MPNILEIQIERHLRKGFIIGFRSCRNKYLDIFVLVYLRYHLEFKLVIENGTSKLL